MSLLDLELDESRPPYSKLNLSSGASALSQQCIVTPLGCAGVISNCVQHAPPLKGRRCRESSPLLHFEGLIVTSAKTLAPLFSSI